MEESVVLGVKAKAKWISEGLRNQLVISQPPCLDNSNKLITRICLDGLWHPSTTPRCEAISQSDESCPDNYREIEEYCVQVTEPRQWQPNYYFHREPQKIHFGNESEGRFWLPVRRVVSYGPFEYTRVGEDYGKTFPVNIANYTEFYSGDCLVFDAKTEMVQVDSCTSLNRFVQYFDKKFLLYDCPKNCLRAGFDSYKCYCRSKDCEDLARFKTAAEKKTLQMLVGNDWCRVGKDPLGIMSGQGLDLYLNRTHLQYGNFRTNCRICQRSALDVKEAHMVLTFEEKNTKLFLLIYVSANIKQYKGKYMIYCFTNSAQNRLKQTLKIERVFEDGTTLPYSLSVYRVNMKKYMGEYWCEAFSSTMSLLKSNKIIAYRKKRGNEYALRLLIRDVCKKFTCDLSELLDDFIDEKLKLLFKPFNSEIRLMEIFTFDTYQDYLDVLFHVSTGRNLNVTNEYYRCLARLKSVKSVEVVYFKSSEFCLPEKTWYDSCKLSWPVTKLNNAVVPNEFCLREDGTPVTRLCTGSFLYGADWSNVTGSCAQNVEVSEVTKKLRELATRDSVSLQNIWSLISGTSLTVLDIYYLNILLDKIRENDSSYALDLVNKIMMTNPTVLKQSQRFLNLTDSVLDVFDDLLSNATFDPDAVYVYKKDKLIVHMANPFLTNISGLLLYGKENTPLTDFSLVDFQRDNIFDNIDKQDLHLAVYVPELILDQILNETENNISDVFIITVVFYNDNLFVDDNFDSTSYVISVTIPGYGSYLQSPISIVFRSNKPSDRDQCGYWDNGKRLNSKKGHWSILGGNYCGKFNDTSLHLCNFVHLTHFALLLMSDKKNVEDENATFVDLELEEYNDYVLNVITIVGCSLSVVGLVGIFLTALLFEKWRNKHGTKILLNMAVAILLELICIQLSEIQTLKQSPQECKIIGMILHYFVLSQFCWMLIYAFLQYYRFVKVIGAIPNNLILKSVIFGWGAPLVLVCIVGFTTTQSYVSSTYELCYPRGMLLYLTVILPIVLIVLANLVIFCMVMYNVIYTKATTSDKKLFRLRVYLALMLFSLLGMPWVFGLLAEILNPSFLKTVLFFIFCVTGTLQGFVLFLFYVVLNQETREFWLSFFRNKKFS
jgi:hypothetical protein